MEFLQRALQRFGIGRFAAVAGGAAGIAAILIAVMLRLGSPPMSLLYSNLDLKEAGEITSALDAANVKYQVKGDGSTIMVDRDKVASARLLLSGKGLPTSGSVGYEIFDSAPALGQTDFVQNLNAKRAMEGELARTIRSIQGVQSARVLLNLPAKQLFQDDVQSPSASIMLVTGGRRVGVDQVRAIRNLVAAGVPDLKPERVAIADQSGDLLAGVDDPSASAQSSLQQNEVEARLQKTIKDMVEGVVGPGHARVTVSADLDMSRVTTQEDKFDPDGQVVRSTRTTSNNAKENKPGSSAQVSAAQNVPNPAGAAGGGDVASTTGATDELTNYEISHTTTTKVDEPGEVKKLSVAVAVDGVTTSGPKGKTSYAPRSAEEMKHIQELVSSAMGFDATRHDQLSVVNVRFDHGVDGAEGVTAASPFTFDKNDVLRGLEMVVLLAVAALFIFFVARPMLKMGPPMRGGMPQLIGALGQGGGMDSSFGVGSILAGDAGGGQMALAGPMSGAMDSGIDIARIEGQVKTSSVRKVAEFVDKHPDESISILRSWLHEA